MVIKDVMGGGWSSTIPWNFHLKSTIVAIQSINNAEWKTESQLPFCKKIGEEFSANLQVLVNIQYSVYQCLKISAPVED